MDRRTFLLTGASLATAAGSAWPWLAQAAASADQTRAFAIVDSTLACGAAFARYAAYLRLPTFDTRDDAGALWFTTLAPLIDAERTAHTMPALIGFTRGSDYFVLQYLALRTGRFVEHRHEARDGSAAPLAHVAFALTPRTARS